MGGLFGQSDGAPPVLVQVMPLVLLGAVFYVLLVRPEQKRRRDHDQLVAALKRNDQIVMASGIHGRVMGLSEKTITVEIAPKVQVTVDRSAIQSVERGAEKPAEVKS
ncbi:MAG TPA: preprotein translocase subunit YajC [Candidatus Binatia bacterium]|nr:preprotein translocase subunit YajC [Candidatus Binatia bacterium]